MIYELSLSPNYVSNWGFKEAIRELLQNAIDAEKDGHEMKVDYNCNELTISSKGASLDASQLILGNSGKNSSELIGKYGEGFKLALLVLERNGYHTTIFNDGIIWIPEFINSKTYNTRVLSIRTDHLKEGTYDSGLVFRISNITSDEYRELIELFPCITKDYGEVVECDTGYILKDPKFKGKMFVEGLYIQSDDEFRYGYNFNADIVNLDRDRKAINYYDLRKLTARSLITGETCDSDLVNAIGSSCTDIRDLEKVLDDASDNFLEQYRDIFYATKGLKKDTLVATKAVVKQLKQLDNNSDVIEGTEIQAYLIAKANDKLDLLEQAQEETNAKSDVDEAIDYLIGSSFAKLKNWIYRAKHNEEATLEELEDISNEYDLTSYNYRKLKEYIPDDFDFTDENILNLKGKIQDDPENE